MDTQSQVSEVPVIQVLKKDQYFSQHIIPLPSAIPYPSLGTSSLRVRTKVIALSANNFTYAKLGFLFHWWDIYPLPIQTPAPYNDNATYGRINAWGWAEVLESTHSSIPAGSFLWGFQPIGSLAHDLVVRDSNVPGQAIVMNDHRQHITPVYNRYIIAKGAEARDLAQGIHDRTDGIAYDALLRVMYETAFLMNRYALSTPAIPPSTMPGASTWTGQHANSKDATFFLFAPASKAGLCFAYELGLRGDKDKASRVIGVTSDSSVSFTQETGLYDCVLSINESPLATLTRLGVGKDEKIILVDFGGRGNAADRWALELSSTYEDLLSLTVGGELAQLSPVDVLSGFGPGPSAATIVNAGDMRDLAMQLDGEAEYFAKLESAWSLLRAKGFKGLKPRWGRGMQDVEKAWDELAKGMVQPNEGLVVVL